MAEQQQSLPGWYAKFIGVVTILSAAGCTGVPKDRLTLPQRYSLVREQLVVHSDFPLAAQHRLLEDLTARRFDVSRQLALPLGDEPVHVYLFDGPEWFDAFMRLHYPDFPRRRAFFVETDTRLMVYGYWGDRVAEDLRHEVTHGYLHSMVPNLPLWLDEGLAEYFEVPRGQNGTNRAHLKSLLDRLEHRRWQPDLRRIERLDRPLDMTGDDYAECWAWVHLLLNSRPEHRDLLLGYLAELRREGSVEPFWPRLGPVFRRPDEVLIDHVRRLAPGRGP